MVGLCHGVHDVARVIAGHVGAARGSMEYTPVGMNHFTWFTEVLVDGKDVMPRLLEVAARKLGEGVNTETRGRYFAEAGDSNETQALSLGWPFTWELTRLPGTAFVTPEPEDSPVPSQPSE